jgi:hypothetical protein
MTCKNCKCEEEYETKPAMEYCSECHNVRRNMTDPICGCFDTKPYVPGAMQCVDCDEVFNDIKCPNCVKGAEGWVDVPDKPGIWVGSEGPNNVWVIHCDKAFIASHCKHNTLKTKYKFIAPMPENPHHSNVSDKEIADAARQYVYATTSPAKDKALNELVILAIESTK